MTGQSRRHSAIEATTNVAIGYGVALAGQLLVFPLYGLHPHLADNLAIGIWFTGLSLARSYVLRRLFNTRTQWVERRGDSRTWGK